MFYQRHQLINNTFQNGSKTNRQPLPLGVLQSHATTPPAQARPHQFLPEYQPDDLYWLHLHRTQRHLRKNRVLRLLKHQIRQFDLRRSRRCPPRQHHRVREWLSLHGWVRVVQIRAGLQHLSQRNRRVLHPQRHLFGDQLIGLFVIHYLYYNMQVTPMQSFQPTPYHKSSEESLDNCGKCYRNQVESASSSDNSSSEEISESFSIELRANKVDKSTPNLKHLESEIKRLSAENQILMQKNKELLMRLQSADAERSLKKQLKAKEKQINFLKNQLSNSVYGLSPSSKSQLESPFISKKKLQIQDSERLKSNKSKLPKNEYFYPPNNTEFQISEVRELREKWKIQKIELQRHIYTLEEKILVYESQTSWMLNLTSKLIGLSHILGSVFKQKPIESRWPVKRQAKQAWRYLKHVLHYFLLIE